MFSWFIPALTSLWEFMVGAAPVVTAGASIYNGYQQTELAKDSLERQEEAQKAAEEKQKQADYDAEKKRLEALAKNQEGQQGFDFGVDSALAKRYADAAQKWGAGTGSMNEDDDQDNPFYTKGLL